MLLKRLSRFVKRATLLKGLMGLEKTHFSHTFYDCKLMATHIIAIAMMEAKA